MIERDNEKGMNRLNQFSFCVYSNNIFFWIETYQKNQEGDWACQDWIMKKGNKYYLLLFYI